LRNTFSFPEIYILSFDDVKKILYLKTEHINPLFLEIIKKYESKILDNIYLSIKLLNENVERKYLVVQIMGNNTIQIEDTSIDFDLKQYDLVVKRHSLISEILSSFIDIYDKLNIEQVKYYYEENILSIILNEKMVIKKSNNFDFLSFIIKGVNIIKSNIYYKGFLNMYICDVLSYELEDLNYVIKIKLSVLTKEDILMKNVLINQY